LLESKVSKKFLLAQLRLFVDGRAFSKAKQITSALIVHESAD